MSSIGTKLKKYGRKSFLITVISLSIVICIISFEWVNRTTLSLLRTTRNFLSVYTQNLQVEVFTPIENSAFQIQTLLRIGDELTEQNLKDELYQIEKSTFCLDRIWVLSEDGKIMYPPDVTRKLIELHPWWKVYEDNTATEFRHLHGRNFFDYFLAPAFRDDLNLSTILPIVMRNVSAEGKISYAFLEFNLTQLLNQFLNEFDIKLGNSAEQIEVIIYNHDGTALETSKNLPLKTEEMPRYYAEAGQYGTMDFDQGLIFRKNFPYVSILSQNNVIGLVFCSRVPIKNIIHEARMNYLFIGVIASLFLLVFSVLLVMVIRTNRNLQNHEFMEVKLRFENLQARMNPHFLFNVLDGLVGLIELSDKDKALEMIKALSYILHVDLREPRIVISLTDELKYIRKYVFLQDIRYKGRFEFKIEIDDSVPERIRIMRYCIQPLVENSFVHGVYQLTRFITITIRIRCQQGSLCIAVSDDGPGCSDDKRNRLSNELSSFSGINDKKIGLDMQEKHLGLISINQRIQYMYGNPYGLRVVHTEKGFCTEVLLPIIPGDSEDSSL